MTKHELSQLKYLKNEIELLKYQILGLEAHTTKDSVKASMSDFPYIQYTAVIEGVDADEYNKKRERLQRKLNRRVAELMEAVEEAEEYIQSIDDSLTRQILSLRYINGLSWGQVAASIGGNNTADGVRMIAERFLSKR
ncbi:RNA polymerase subunit sigma-24 [Sedimentibacter hydroxybenzoicus DSM 7310]|uniref:RNA polymerase subunit sigma-24 n=1 Tax=Sedimentibacter hydroxybenzoicus DSM 7310 TaxID=1123245 RepID=A0A974GUY3_SEDHY|nr:RNA polymerase subunit sigma-24 [Sedimentibacter hydroxybenzoicus]NYB72520.1 RNA polymerase subunit sigma-24 [Sedimentibacter hydroxybenzoicus DSM 7310]